jgi:hypothetical protein
VLPSWRRKTRFANTVTETGYSAVGIATDYGLNGRIGVRFSVRAGAFFFSIASIPGLQSTHTSIRWVPGTHFPWVKRQGLEAEHSPPPSVEVPHTYSWRGA